MNGRGNGYGNGYRNGNGYSNGNGYGRSSGLPNGSYAQSCTGAHMQGAMLFATCPSGNGQRQQTSINTQSCRNDADIANRNGYLDCER